MDVNEMRRILDKFCEANNCHEGCPLHTGGHRCGRGAYFTRQIDTVGYMSDDEIIAAYNVVFPARRTGIKDSGERTTFASGAVRDMHAGKGRMDLLPWEAIIEVSKHCEEGALKYGEHNVDKGIPIHSLVDSGARHLGKYIMGETDEPHLRAAAWNLLWAIYMEIRHPELQDLPTRSNIWEDKTESGLLEE